MLRQSHSPRGIQSGGPHRIFQTPIRELGDIADGAVHREHAAGKFAILGAFAVHHVNLDRAEPIFSVRHSGRGGRVCDQHRALGSFCAQE